MLPMKNFFPVLQGMRSPCLYLLPPFPEFSYVPWQLFYHFSKQFFYSSGLYRRTCRQEPSYCEVSTLNAGASSSFKFGKCLYSV